MKEMKELAKAVQEMRAMQKAYFKATQGTPEKREFLKKSIETEKAVDEMVAKILNPQSNLF